MPVLIHKRILILSRFYFLRKIYSYQNSISLRRKEKLNEQLFCWPERDAFIYFIQLLDYYNNITFRSTQPKPMQKIYLKINPQDSFNRKFENSAPICAGELESLSFRKNDKFECSSCSKFKDFIKEIKSKINALQNEKTQLLNEFELNLFHFSYIVELVSKNIWKKHQDIAQNIKQMQQKTLRESVNTKEFKLMQIVATQKNEIDTLKQRILKLESENQNFKLSIKKSMQTESSLSFSQCDKSFEELPSFGPILENEEKGQGSISLPLLYVGNGKQQSIDELRERLNQIRVRVSRISESQVFCPDF